MREPETNPDAPALALAALGWILSDSSRAERLLDMTGLSPDALRARLGDSTMLAAILGFLESHEPDLVACAESLDVAPDALVRARTELEDA